MLFLEGYKGKPSMVEGSWCFSEPNIVQYISDYILKALKSVFESLKSNLKKLTANTFLYLCFHNCSALLLQLILQVSIFSLLSQCIFLFQSFSPNICTPVFRSPFTRFQTWKTNWCTWSTRSDNFETLKKYIWVTQYKECCCCEKDKLKYKIIYILISPNQNMF